MSEVGLELQPAEQALDVSTENLLLDTQKMNMLYKLARTYSNSLMVPAAYRGQPDNCFVALELAARMCVSPVLVMQQLYVVEGRPAWSGQACIALINGCGLFDALEFVYIGEEGTLGWGCYAQAIRRSTGQLVKGSAITMQMAKDEGWLDKRGSKWKTMPQQMFAYRAASFFARTHCPNVLMGYQTAEEVQDVHGNHEETAKTVIKFDGGQSNE